MMLLGLRKLGNICCGHKMFLNKIRNIFCVPDTKPQQMLRARANGETFVSAKMCPQHCVLVCHGLKRRQEQEDITHLKPGGLFPYMSYIGMSGPKWFFFVVSVSNRVSFLHSNLELGMLLFHHSQFKQ